MILFEGLCELFDNFRHALDIKHSHSGIGTRNLNRERWAREAYEKAMKEEKNKKMYISADKLLEDSFDLALKIYNSGYEPNWIVGIWRGGTPIGIAVQELLEYLGIKTDHISIRTSAYDGIGKQNEYIRVHGLEYIVKNINSDDSMLIVDDVFDTGRSVYQVIKQIHQYCRKNTPEIKIATPYFKPENNLTTIHPDYYLHKTDKWIVFPHEINGLTAEEIVKNKSYLASKLEKII